MKLIINLLLFLLLAPIPSLANTKFQETLDYCNNFPKTKEFKKLKKFRILNIDFYHNNKEVVYVDLREGFNYINNNFNTGYKTSCILHKENKIHNIENLLNTSKDFYIEYYELGCSDEVFIYKEKEISFKCECDVDSFRIILDSCKINMQFDK